ncbi:hypothetical protein GCM10027403_19980 [Arthrobacter tecti]
MLFVLLALTESPKWSAEIRTFLDAASSGTLAVDEQSLHRALRRLEALNVITHATQPARGTGAKRKVYELTASGERILAAYLQTTMAYLDNSAFVDAIAAAKRAD